MRFALRLKHMLVLLALAFTCQAISQGQLLLQKLLHQVDSTEATGSHEQAIRQAGTALEVALAAKDSAAIARIRVKRATIYLNINDYTSALVELQTALPIYERIGDQGGVADVYNTIGSIHYYDRNFDQAEEYYRKSLGIQLRLANQAKEAMLYGNIGSALQELGHLDSAMAFHRNSLALWQSLGKRSWLPFCYTNMGACFSRMGESDSAMHYMELARSFYPNGDSRSVGYCQFLIEYGIALIPGGRYREAIRVCTQANDLAKSLGVASSQVQCYECLFKAHRAMGNAAMALQMYQQYIALRDSISNDIRNQDLLRLDLNYGFKQTRLADSLKQTDEQHQAELNYGFRISRERYQKRIYLLGGLLILGISVALWRRLRYIQRSRLLIQQERDRSDRLLLNILPEPIAEELKVHGHVKVREVHDVSILFTDFNEFTKATERMAAQDLVAEIDACYRAFDGVVKKYGLEKIKTIGDAYMCAGGLPEPKDGSARNTVLAALEMQDWLQARAMDRESKGLPTFRMRAGIHTGHVVAGVVGESKFQYDVWGDTVNTAARMESAGAVDEVNISEATLEVIKDEPCFSFSPRGRIRAKGKGELTMFFVKRISPVGSLPAASEQRA